MPQPNFIIFLTDDHGYGDLSCMGATDVRTPYLDRLAADGVRFTNWYANSSVCSPSRASLLTGRYPGNAGVRAILSGVRTTTGLPPTVPTLAGALRDRGYRTAMSGKWHLGVAEGYRPQNHGFDDWFGFLGGVQDYYSHIHYYCMSSVTGIKGDPVHDLWENGKEIFENGEYLTHLITERAVRQIRRAAASDQPFFLFVAYNAPHFPMHAPKRYVDRFPHLAPDRRIMAAMISALDDGIGEIMAELARHGLVENTCVFFMGDNGPSRETRNWLDGRTDPYYGGTAGQLKGHKFSLYEGGIRVPGILHWPARVPGGQVLDWPAAAMDIFPTFFTAAGGDPSGYELDGVDIFPMLAEGVPAPPRDLYWELGGQTAVRRGQWKLVLKGQLVEGAPPEDDVHLADLDADMAERRNLAAARPEVAAELTTAAEAWRARIEERWQREWLPQVKSTTSHPTK